MKHLFIPYELAVIAKQKGFNEPCIGAYDVDSEEKEFSFTGLDLGELRQKSATNLGYLCAPLYQQILGWLRDQPRFIQILEQPETFTDKEPMYCVKMRGSYAKEKMTINAAIIEAFKLV